MLKAFLESPIITRIAALRSRLVIISRRFQVWIAPRVEAGIKSLVPVLKTLRQKLSSSRLSTAKLRSSRFRPQDVKGKLTELQWTQVSVQIRRASREFVTQVRKLDLQRISRSLSGVKELLIRMAKRGPDVRKVRLDESVAWAKTIPSSLAAKRLPDVSALRLDALMVRARHVLSLLRTRWLGLGRVQRYVVGGVGALLIAGIILGFFAWTGISAALDARDSYRDLQAQMSHLTPLDLIQVTAYQTLEADFKNAEEKSSQARSRLAFLKPFGWLPVVGGKITEAHVLLDMGFHQARAGRHLASAYRSAISVDVEQMEPNLAADRVARTIRELGSELSLVQSDLRRVRELRQKLGATERGETYGVLMDRYLPALQTVAYLSLTSPEVIGHTYALSRELSSLQDSVADPLDVLEDPEQVGQVLSNVNAQAVALELAIETVKLATSVSGADSSDELAAVNDVLDTVGPGVTLLRHVTAGARGLVQIAEAVDSTGFLSKEFGAIVGVALDETHTELALAKEEMKSLQTLMSVQGIDAESFLPATVFSAGSDLSLGGTDRVEVLLDEAISTSNFLRSFLGFDEPRDYLLLGQNQNEIRASGGFIGIAVQATIDRGELTTLVYHDSTTVDREPLTDNPLPPGGLFWYLWMGRMLFRDANWSPHFPASAAQIADIYRTGQGTQVDGVITATKQLAFDLVDLFGDIKVPEREEVLTRDTAEALTEGEISYECLPRHKSSDRSKRCFDEDLFFALKDRLTSGIPPGLRRQFIELIKAQLDQKNVLTHVFPPMDDSLLWERGWNGAISVVDHDYIMVVDSSLPGHSTAGVDRSWEYRVSLSPNQPIEAELRLRYENKDQPKDEICRQFDWPTYHCYWNYFRVYVPKMADQSTIQMPPVPLHPGALKLIWGYPDANSGTVASNLPTTPGRLTELGGYIAVEPGTVTTVPIGYQLPREILRSTAPNVYEYRLLIQKQPGMDRDRVSLAVELDSNVELISSVPEFTSRRGQQLLFDFTLESDTRVVVSFRTKGRAEFN